MLQLKKVFTNVTIKTLAPIINIMGLANNDESLNPSRGYQFNDNKKVDLSIKHIQLTEQITMGKKPETMQAMLEP